MRPTLSNAPNVLARGITWRSPARSTRSATGRSTRRSSICPPDVEQRVIRHARRTGGLAIAAGQAPVEMQLRLVGHRFAFEHLLDQIDASARPVEFVAEQLIGRAGRIAETAMHA